VAYRRWSEVFDPEKHGDPALKNSAAAKLLVIKEAFDGNEGSLSLHLALGLGDVISALTRIAYFETFFLFFLVLSDPKQRAEYDRNGDNGVASKWDIGHKVKTPQEVGTFL
jgi:DnaJ family protein C protein 11